ncbi:nucleotidyltransferase family protein [Bacillus sp. B-jedd]|uniref:nucleotidyltransferase family protein n=1 Tax=Bacillus sp. B-jedd TaxID=1476857 RepID=UPI0005157192|nr:nucleotidyltransferase family protein [Bacillus sp. B-jedd]CEG28932.1 xanthine dehydrogenase [Bacillus sp. B-jedd]
MRFTGIYLAAGKSRRMGTDKRKLPIGGKPLGSIGLEHALQSRLDHIFVVTGKGDQLDWLRTSFFLYPERGKWSQVDCADSAKGLGFSLQKGVKKAAEAGAEAVMVLLADQPFVHSEDIDSLIDCYQGMQDLFVGAKGADGIARPPILFSSEAYRFFENPSGDEGLRSLLRGEFAPKGRAVEFQHPLFFYDVDTKEDYQVLLEKFR